MRSTETGWGRGALAWLAALALLAGSAWGARPPGGDGVPPDPPPGPDCLGGATASFWASPATITLGQGGSTVHWAVHAPAGCAGMTQSITTRGPVASNGSFFIQPISNVSYILNASFHGGSRELARTAVTVDLPQEGGRPAVTITANDQQALLVQALGTPNALVRVQNHVDMDLSGRDTIEVAGGVTLLGGRTSRIPGARLYTRSFPRRFLMVRNGDDVHISGLRLDGGEPGVADSDAPGSIGISVLSRHNVEIDNNEIYGWRGIGVEVSDSEGRIHLATNPMTVRVHDNFIHHNQHQRGEGYGVALKAGAYALIERNVFDWNRHAIEGDGADGTGYLAYRNLVLEHGGLNAWIPFPGFWTHTHQFDMHGLEDCYGYDLYCGQAGEFMDVRHNTILYTAGTGYKVRGTPSFRADATQNVFAHTDEWGGFVDDGALANTEVGLYAWDNQFGVNALNEAGWCDFDGDGVTDRFLATGQTWWFSSAGTGPWVYLNTSTRRLAEVELVPGAGRCDVVAEGVVSRGGTGPWRPLDTNLLWQNGNGQLRLWFVRDGLPQGEAPGAIDPTWRIEGTGDFEGDGEDDILARRPDGQIVIREMRGGQLYRETLSGDPAQVLGWTVQGVGDFDGDRLADILWRNDLDGQLAIWFRGDGGRGVLIGYHNVPGPVSLIWAIQGLGDFNGDGRTDIVWRHHLYGEVAVWQMAGAVYTGESYGSQDPLQWGLAGSGDFDGDGRSDLLWRRNDGQLSIWFKADPTTARTLPGPMEPTAQVQAVADFNSDGRSDILWRDDHGVLDIWMMNGALPAGEVHPPSPGTSWQLKGLLEAAR
jgi:VCBS repeat protein/parallel beta helix pectate lyase-like protein